MFCRVLLGMWMVPLGPALNFMKESWKAENEILWFWVPKRPINVCVMLFYVLWCIVWHMVCTTRSSSKFHERFMKGQNWFENVWVGKNANWCVDCAFVMWLCCWGVLGANVCIEIYAIMCKSEIGIGPRHYKLGSRSCRLVAFGTGWGMRKWEMRWIRGTISSGEIKIGPRHSKLRSRSCRPVAFGVG